MFEFIEDLIREIVGWDGVITVDTDLRKDIEFDSLDFLELLNNLEETYHVEFLQADVERMNTIQDLIQFIVENRE